MNQEFIDHSLLAPEYIRDPSFIMELMDQNPAEFTKSVANDEDVGHMVNSRIGVGGIATFHSETTSEHPLFHYGGQLKQRDRVTSSGGGSSDVVVSVVPVSRLRATSIHQNERTGNFVRHKLASAATAAAEEFISLSGDFLAAAAVTTDCGQVEGEVGTVVPQFPAFSLLEVPDSADELLQNGNVLPHKKRISRKLKADQADCSFVGDGRSSVWHGKLSTEERLRSSATLQFTCELCSHSTSSQLKFFAHLKQHYEPQTMTCSPPPLQPLLRAPHHHGCSSLSVDLHSPVALVAPVPRTTTPTGLHTSLHTPPQLNLPLSIALPLQPNMQSPPPALPLHHQTISSGLNGDTLKEEPRHRHDGCVEEAAVVAATVDQVFHDVQLNFDDFAHVGVFAPAESGGADDADDIKILNAHPQPFTLPLPVHRRPVSSSPTKALMPAAGPPSQEDTMSASEVEVEFSDNEDMLEGIRNVVDKVSIEDTCDDIDLIAASHNGSGSTDSFGGLAFTQPAVDGARHEELSFGASLAARLPAVPNLGGVPLQGPIMGAEKLSSGPMNRKLQNTEEHARHYHMVIATAAGTEVVSFGAHDGRGKDDYILGGSDHDSLNLSGRSEGLASDSFVSATERLAGSLEGDDGGGVDSDGYFRAHSDDDGGVDSEEFLPLVRSELKGEPASPQQVVLPRSGTSSTPTTPVRTSTPLTTTPLRETPITARVSEAEEGEGGAKQKHLCDKCDRQFNSRNALRYHVRTHSGDRPFQCSECERTFVVAGALKSHLESHAGLRTHECPQCQRRFRLWADLKHHLLSRHSGEKSHQCEYCGKAFARKYSLVLHRRIHTNERNYACEFCTKTFRANIYLQNHRRTHTGEKPYECAVCAKKFRVSGDLTRHSRTHQPRPQCTGAMGPAESGEAAEHSKKEELEKPVNVACPQNTRKSRASNFDLKT